MFALSRPYMLPSWLAVVLLLSDRWEPGCPWWIEPALETKVALLFSCDSSEDASDGV